MLKSRLYKILSLSALLALCLSAPAYSGECYKVSPNLASLGDQYYSMGAHQKPSDSDIKQLDRYFSAIEGDWSGNAQVIECPGSMENPEERKASLGVESTMQSNGEGSLKIDHETYNRSDRTIALEKLELSGNADNQRFELSGRGVVFEQKYRVPNADGGTRLFEKIINTSGMSDTLSIRITTYVNGYLASKETWELERD